jgi:hypothetical protein
MRMLLRRLLLGKRGLPAALITAVTGRDQDSGWSVFWVGDGVSPPSVDAPTLTEVVNQATSAVAALYARWEPIEGAVLQFAIYPSVYDGGPIFDIAARPDSLTARDIQGSNRIVHGITLEDLVTAIDLLPEVADGDAMLRWLRPIATLPPHDLPR